MNWLIIDSNIIIKLKIRFTSPCIFFLIKENSTFWLTTKIFYLRSITFSVSVIKYQIGIICFWFLWINHITKMPTTMRCKNCLNRYFHWHSSINRVSWPCHLNFLLIWNTIFSLNWLTSSFHLFVFVWLIKVVTL